MARILILVHGMGVNAGDWAAGVVGRLNATSKRYAVFQGVPPLFVAATDADDDTTTTSPDQVLVVPVGYDAVMRKHVHSFGRDIGAITSLAGTEGIPISKDLKKILDTFAKAGETEKNFFWSHVVDVLLYHFFPLVTKPVRVTVMRGIARVLQRTDATVSIMGHSLGTSVVHDSLQMLGSGMFQEFAGCRPPGIRFANIFMVANVSRVLEKSLDGDADVFNSCVCPVSVRGDDAFCDDFYNFRHMLDPFPLPKRFEPQWIGADFHAIERLLHVGDFNVHGWEHYLDNPEVHIPVINALMGDRLVTDDVAAAAIANYKVAPTPLCAKGMDFWVAETRKIHARLSDRQTVPELLLAAGRFFATVQLARAKCGQTVNIAGLTLGDGGEE